MTWGQMCLREFIIKGVAFGFVNAITSGSSGWSTVLGHGEDRRSLHDMVAGSCAYADSRTRRPDVL